MKSLACFFAACLATLALAFSVTWTADVESQWSSPDYATMAQWPRGHAWQFGDWRAMRDAKTALIRRSEKPDLAIFGSSRVQHLGRPHLKAYPKALNLNLIAANLFDLAALWQCLVEEGKLPGTVILMADPWLLNGNQRQDYFTHNAPLAARFIRQSGLPAHAKLILLQQLLREWVDVHFKRAVGLKTYRESSQRLRSKEKKLPQGFAEVGAFARPRMAGILEDGRLISEWSFGLKHVDKRIFPGDGYLLQMEDWGGTGLTKAFLREWLRALQRAGCKVLVASSVAYGPYQAAMQARYPGAFQEFEACLLGLKEEGLIQGLILKKTPEDYGCPGDQYFDSSHVFPQCLERIAAELLQAEH